MRILLIALALSCSLRAQAQHPYVYMRIEGLDIMLFGPAQDARLGALNEKGAVVIAPKYAALSDFGAEGAVAILDSTYGFVFRDGRERWFPELQKLYRLSEGLAPAQKDGKWGFIDKKGRTIIPFLYAQAMPFHEGYAAVQLGKRWKMVDKKGRPLLGDRYTFSNYPVYAGKTVFVVADSTTGTQKKGILDVKGNIVVPAIYDEVAGFFAEGLCWVRKGKQEGFVNQKGEPVFLMDATFPQRIFSEGLVVALQGGFAGYLDVHGQGVIPFEYGDGNNFSEGLAAVIREGKMGFINRKNERIIPFELSSKTMWQSNFKQGRVVVQDAATGKFGYIDVTGRMVIPAIYDQALPFDGGYGYVKKEEKVGFVDLVGREVVPCEYTEVWSYENGLARFAVPK